MDLQLLLLIVVHQLVYKKSFFFSKEKINYDPQASVSPLVSRASLTTEREARFLQLCLTRMSYAFFGITLE